MSLDTFLAGPQGPTERISKSARAALREGPADVAAVTVTKANGVAVTAPAVAVVCVGELARFEKALLAQLPHRAPRQRCFSGARAAQPPEMSWGDSGNRQNSH